PPTALRRHLEQSLIRVYVILLDSSETFINPAHMLCDARLLGVVRLRGDVAENLLKIVQVEGDDNRGTVSHGHANSAFEVPADESMVKDQLPLTVGQPDRNPLTRLDALHTDHPPSPWCGLTARISRAAKRSGAASAACACWAAPHSQYPTECR